MQGPGARSPMPAAATLERPRAARRRPAEGVRPAPRSWADLAGVGFLLVLAVAFISPALWQGTVMGPFDVAARASSLTHGLYHGVHNALSSDQVTELLPWGQLNWEAVHHLQLPLWNSFSGDGMPLAFNFQAASFSLPHLIGYLFPLRDSFLASTGALLAIGGTGAFVFARVLGLGALSAVAAASAFELCGRFALFPWPLAGVAAWTGWVLALVVVCYRTRALRYVAGLAVVSAFAVYGGSPEMLALVGFTVVVFMVLFVPACAVEGRGVEWRGLARVLAGGLSGAGLSAPLWLPGAQVILGSSRVSQHAWTPLPVSSMAGLVGAGYYGSPLSQSLWFGPLNYYKLGFYVGVPVLVLTATALLGRWRRPAVVALGGTALALILVTWQIWPVSALLSAAPRIGVVKLGRASYPLSLVLALLAGIGVQALLDLHRRAAVSPSGSVRGQDRLVRLGYVAGLLVVAGVLAWWLADAGSGGLSARELAIRRQSLLWPAGLLALLAVLSPVLLWSRPGRRAALVGATALVVAEAACLLAVGVPLSTYGTRYFPVTPAVAALRRAVGGSLVALDGGQRVTQFPGVGLYPETNVGYGIRELAIYDPLIPGSYFSSWAAATGTAPASGAFFIPDVTSAAMARRYGASWILAGPGRPPPPGTVYDATVAGERLYRVPRSGRFVVGAGKVVSATPVGDAGWRLMVDAREPTHLRAAVVGLPGWHASVDGRAAALHAAGGPGQSLALTPGHHVVELWYWPRTFTVGLCLGALSVAALASAGCLGLAARRRGSPAAPRGTLHGGSGRSVDRRAALPAATVGRRPGEERWSQADQAGRT